MTQVWNTPLTPLAFLRRSAEVFPDKTAVVYGDRRISYRRRRDASDPSAAP